MRKTGDDSQSIINRTARLSLPGQAGSITFCNHLALKRKNAGHKIKHDSQDCPEKENTVKQSALTLFTIVALSLLSVPAPALATAAITPTGATNNETGLAKAAQSVLNQGWASDLSTATMMRLSPLPKQHLKESFQERPPLQPSNSHHINWRRMTESRPGFPKANQE
jgi:hypothetical protein